MNSLAAIRKGRVLRSGEKLLLILDQFEQWLHGNRSEGTTELVTALRQCDGEHLQAVVMVRDEFWLNVSRVMADLEVELSSGQNVALVDLFAPRHAKKVLTLFGQAYGTLSGKATISPGTNVPSWIKRFRDWPTMERSSRYDWRLCRNAKGTTVESGDSA